MARVKVLARVHAISTAMEDAKMDAVIIVVVAVAAIVQVAIINSTSSSVNETN